MAIADRSGLPVAAGIASASPHEVTLVDETIDNGFLEDAPEHLIGDMAYDSDGLDERLMRERGIEMIAPNRRNRRSRTQDGRPLRTTDGSSRDGSAMPRTSSASSISDVSASS
jgi:hypothetical protein